MSQVYPVTVSVPSPSSIDAPVRDVIVTLLPYLDGNGRLLTALSAIGASARSGRRGLGR